MHLLITFFNCPVDELLVIHVSGAVVKGTV
jgi:hypothetical protein